MVVAGHEVIDDIRVGDVLRLRKAHPCGSDRWRVRRVGGDVGLVCEGCGRRIFMTRSELRRRVRKTARKGDGARGCACGEGPEVRLD